MQDIEKIIEEAQRLQLLEGMGNREERSRALVELRALFGLKDDEDDNNPSPIISDHPEVLECIMPKSYGRPANGGNQILLDSVLDGSLWFRAVCAEGYGHGSGSLPSVFDIPFRSRQEALWDAVAIFYKKLKAFPQNTPREKKLVSVLEKWLEEIENDLPESLREKPSGRGIAENGELNVVKEVSEEGDIKAEEQPNPRQDRGAEQLRLGQPEDGFILLEDLETERQGKIRRELETVTGIRNTMRMMQKAYSRQALYLSIVSVIEEARIRSAGSPGERVLAADVEGRMRVLAGDEMTQDLDGRHLVVYAAFLDGAEVDHNKEQEGRKNDA